MAEYTTPQPENLDEDDELSALVDDEMLDAPLEDTKGGSKFTDDELLGGPEEDDPLDASLTEDDDDSLGDVTYNWPHSY